MKRTLSLTLFAALAFAAAAAVAAVAPDPQAVFALAQHALQSSPDAGSALMALGPLMAFKVREGFVSTVFTVVEIDGRDERRQADAYAGETVKYDAEQAGLNLHKLEPADKAATEFMNSKHAIAEQPVSPASVAELVAAAVADALAAYKAGLTAAGVFAPKPEAAPPVAGGATKTAS
ncbi:MAG: hypothetical protein ABI433_01070 [Burkholderiaceae bacterium]